MPELPEIETTRRGIGPHIVDRMIETVRVRNRQLRWPVPRRLGHRLRGHFIRAVERRAKYLLLRTDVGTLIVHLGMSGSLRVLPADTRPGRYDHVDVVLAGAMCLRLRDPRRFGAVLWATDPYRHPLLRDLGPEPLSSELSGSYLYQRARGRRVSVKSFIMDATVVAGIGNIYANEALFHAGIHPQRPAGRIAAHRYQSLAEAIKQTLGRAIDAGGTTLRDFARQDGKPGYFQQELRVYGRDGTPCPRCQRPIQRRIIGQRSSFFCHHCQR